VSRAVIFVETMTGSATHREAVPLPDWWVDPAGYDSAVVGAATVGPGIDPGTDPAVPIALRDLALAVDPAPGPDDGLAGTVRSGTVRIGDQRYRVTTGRFVALAAGTAGGRRLRYRITAETSAGQRVDVAGVKIVTGRPWRWWTDTTRMYVVLSTVDPDGPTSLSGTVRITLPAFARQLTTLRGRPGDIVRFVTRFAARLMLPASRTGSSRPRSTRR
jgi:hypothetical protein